MLHRYDIALAGSIVRATVNDGDAGYQGYTSNASFALVGNEEREEWMAESQEHSMHGAVQHWVTLSIAQWLIYWGIALVAGVIASVICDGDNGE